MPEREPSQIEERGEHKDSQPQASVSGDEGVLRSPRRMLSGYDNPLHSLLDSVGKSSSETESELRFNNLEQTGRLRPHQERRWGGQGTATERLPDAMLDHLVERPLDSLQQLLDSLERESSRARATLDYEDIGTVRQVGDGVASVWGLPQATTDELLQFPNDVLGLVMNLDRSYTDCILLSSDERIQGGDVVRATGERIMIPVGERLLGRVVDPLGRPLDDLGRVYVNEERFIEREAPGVIARHAVDTPLQTGIKAIDAVIPIGRGQRELIIGDRQTGKTTLALDTIINQADQDVVCVYVSMGQKRSSVLQALRSLEETMFPTMETSSMGRMFGRVSSKRMLAEAGISSSPSHITTVTGTLGNTLTSTEALPISAGAAPMLSPALTRSRGLSSNTRARRSIALFLKVG